MIEALFSTYEFDISIDIYRGKPFEHIVISFILLQSEPELSLYCLYSLLFSPTKLPSLFFAFICPIREFRVKLDDLMELMNEGIHCGCCDGNYGE